MRNLHLDILPLPQRRLWTELGKLPGDFTLYGGTAIALRLGHRQSVDFDFFSPHPFDPDVLFHSAGFLRESLIIAKAANTLTCRVDREGPVLVSFFGLPKLPRLEAPLATENGITLASLPDLAGTKAAVIQKRSEAKDYIDLDALVHQAGISLPQALGAAKKLYGASFNPEITLKALCYYGDGNLGTVPPSVRTRLMQATREVNLDMLP